MGTSSWLLSTTPGRLSLLPLVAFVPLAAFVALDAALLIPALYIVFFAGVALRSGWDVVTLGSMRERLHLALGTSVVALSATMALGLVAVVVPPLVSALLGLLFLYVLYRVLRLFLGGSKSDRSSRSAPKNALPGEVWLVRVPNDNPDEREAFKVRPSVVLTAGPNSITVAYATSQEKRYNQRGYIEVTTLPGWPASEGKRSFLQVNRPLTTSRDALVAKKSVLPEGSYRAVVSMVP